MPWGPQLACHHHGRHYPYLPSFPGKAQAGLQQAPGCAYTPSLKDRSLFFSLDKGN